MNDEKKINTIYDLMAFCYKKICEDKLFDLNKMEKSDKFHCLFLRYIEIRNCNLFEAFSRLKKSLIEFYNCEEFSTQDYYNIILEIDSCEIYIFKSSCNYDWDFKTYKGLNLYLNNEIQIFPTLKTTYIDNLNKKYQMETGSENNFLRDIKNYNITSLNSKLKNFILYRPEEFNSCNIFIHELYEYKDFILNKEKIKIAVFPATYIDINEIFDIKYTKEKNFYIEKMFPLKEKMLLERYIVFLNSIDTDIDFLILPEMLMTEHIFNNIKNIIIEKKIKFMFCGSIWKDNNNICTVLYEGETVFSYNKKVPFELKYNRNQLQSVIKKCSDKQQREVLEDILKTHSFENNNYVIFREKLEKNDDLHIIDINTFGRVSTFICRDIDNDSFINVSKLLLNDFIILPACSPSMDLCNNAVHLAERYHSTTIMCNTCSALCHNKRELTENIKKEKAIGFIITPSKTGSERNHKKLLYMFNENCLSCEKNCTGRIFNISLESLYVENDSISLNIEEIRR